MPGKPAGKRFVECAPPSALMTDLRRPSLMYLKASLLALISIVSCALILIECPRWYVAGLLALAIWSAARVYYFMFYVIERYVDPTFKFAGVGSFLRYVLRRRRAAPDPSATDRHA
jgi:hypothetical protein